MKDKGKRKKLEKQMLAIYKKHNEQEINPVQNITYNNELMMESDNNHAIYGMEDVLQVELKEDKTMIGLYQDGQEIAIINSNSQVIFTEEYLMQMKEISPQIYMMLKQLNSEPIELIVPEKNDKNLPQISDDMELPDFTLTKEELDIQVEIEEKENIQIPELEEPEEKDDEEKIATKMGVSKSDIKSFTRIDPKEKITDAKSFEDIANIKHKGYTDIYVTVNKGKGNSRFTFWGVTRDGQAEQVPGLEERMGVNTGKTINKINRDGTEVKEEQSAALFTLPNGREGFSVEIGQYGISEVTYIRKDPTQNKYIGSKINSSTNRPTTREVKEFMNDARTTDSELQDVIEKAEHQLDETEKTNIRNIDDNPDNDMAIDMDANINLHDGTTTTLRKEAERYDISPDEYRTKFEEKEGDCISDKVEAIREEEREKEEEEYYRDGRLTPEEEALKRRGLL